MHFTKGILDSHFNPMRVMQQRDLEANAHEVPGRG